MSWFRSLESRQTRKAPVSCFPGVAVEFILSIGSLTLNMTPRSSILFNSFSSLSLSATGILRGGWITATASGFRPLCGVQKSRGLAVFVGTVG